MNQENIKRFRVKLTYVERCRLQQVVEEIFQNLEGTGFPHELLPAFIAVYKSRADYVSENRLASIIAETKSYELYRLCVERRALNSWGLSKIMMTGIKDPALEAQLAQELYDIRTQPENINRFAIVRAMACNGTEKSLELLEMIRAELEKSLPAREKELRKLPDGVDVESILKRLPVVPAFNLDVDFYELVKSATIEIEQRLAERINAEGLETIALK